VKENENVDNSWLTLCSESEVYDPESPKYDPEKVFMTQVKILKAKKKIFLSLKN